MRADLLCSADILSRESTFSSEGPRSTNRIANAVLGKLNILGSNLICEEREVIRGAHIEGAAVGLQEEDVQIDVEIGTGVDIQGRALRAEISESVSLLRVAISF